MCLCDHETVSAACQGYESHLGSWAKIQMRGAICTHMMDQIRVHLNANQLPIIGDKSYNPSNKIAKDTPQELAEIIKNFPRQALHSKKLSFKDIDTNEIVSFVASFNLHCISILILGHN